MRRTRRHSAGGRHFPLATSPPVAVARLLVNLARTSDGLANLVRIFHAVAGNRSVYSGAVIGGRRYALVCFALLATNGCYLSHERRTTEPRDSSVPMRDARVDSARARDSATRDSAVPDSRACREERCDGTDDDCDGLVDEGVCTTRATHVSVRGGNAFERACVSTPDGLVACWGGSGLFADDPIAAGRVRPVPQLVEGVTDAFDVDVGGYVACARRADGVVCWEWPDIAEPEPTPPERIGWLDGASALAVGGRYCGVVGGEVRCDPGMTGPEAARFGVEYWTVAGVGPATGVFNSSWNGFVVQRDGALLGWGLNYVGELGDGSVGRMDTPVSIPGMDDVVSGCTGSHFSCAIRVGGRLVCWGELLGVESPDTSTVPVDTSIDDAVAVTCGFSYACALRSDASAWCWGSNYAGQLGDGTRAMRATPTRVPLDDVVDVSAGFATTCAVLGDGSAWCWGNNCHGAIGDGTRDGDPRGDGTCTYVRGPTRVLLP